MMSEFEAIAWLKSIKEYIGTGGNASTPPYEYEQAIDDIISMLRETIYYKYDKPIGGFHD